MRALRSAADPGGSLRDSSVGCDWYCAEACSATRTAANRNGIKCFMVASIQLLQLLTHIGCGDGEVGAVARDDLLRIAAEEEAEELAHLRIQRAARRLVDVDVRVARHRVAAVGDIVRGERNGGPVRRARHRNHLESRVAGALRAVGVHAGAVDVHQCAQPIPYLSFSNASYIRWLETAWPSASPVASFTSTYSRKLGFHLSDQCITIRSKLTANPGAT